jgi:ubiquinone/menaquinone biosynthesis C-methylase UbiE
MKRIFGATGMLAALAVFLSFWWTRRRQLPCPPWLTGILEVPYFNLAAGGQLLLDRAGVRSGMRLLDAGCGPGRVTIPAAERVGPKGSVTALDLQPGMLEQMVRRVNEVGLANVRPILGGLGEGYLPANTFDRALLVTVLGEIPDPVAALREIYASLKPGGVLSLTEVLPDPHYQTRATVRRLATAAGFAVQQVYGNFLAYTINLVKPA